MQPTKTQTEHGAWPWSPQLLKLVVFTISLMLSPALAASQELSQDELRTLENRVWMAEPSDLSSLEPDVTRLIQLEPHSSFAHYLLGHLYLRQFRHNPSDMSRLRKASELAQQAIDLNERSEFGYLLSAAILDLMGYSENAARMIHPEVNTKITESWRTLFVRAQLSAGRDQPDQVLRIIREAMSQEKSAHELIAPYVAALIRSEFEGDDLIVMLREWNQEFPGEIFLQSLAIAYAERGDYRLAVATYETMIKTYPHNLDAQINQAILSYTHLDKLGTGKRLLEQSLANKALVDPDKRSLVQSHLANIHLKNSEKEQARKFFRKAIRNSEEPFEWLSFSHQIYRQTEEFAELAKLIEELKDDIPGSGLLHALHGEILSEHLSKHDLAIRSYNNALVLEPESIEYHNGLGLAYYRQKDMKRALATFTRAIKINPRDATIRYNEACILSILGRTHEALGSLREAVSLDPRLAKTALHDEDFNNIRDTEQFEALVGTSASQLTQFP